MVTVGQLRKLIADLPDEASVSILDRTKLGLSYDWNFDIEVQELKNHSECCGPCDDAQRAPLAHNVPMCSEHSGTQLVIKR